MISLASRIDASLFDCLDECIDQILSLDERGLWISEPPFGGSVDSPDYATAVIVRAAIAQQLAHDESFEVDLALGLTNVHFQKGAALTSVPTELVPFWGSLDLKSEPFCFVQVVDSKGVIDDVVTETHSAERAPLVRGTKKLGGPLNHMLGYLVEVR